MLTRLESGRVQVEVRPPLVYFDHWAIRDISSDPVRRDHLLETFRTRGTLMVSVINMVEMARNSGESYARIRDLLDDLEPHWILSEIDPQVVQSRMEQNVPPPLSFFPVDLFGIIYNNLPEGTLKLGSALDRLQDPEFREYARKQLTEASDLLGSLRRARERHLNGERMIPIPHPERSPLWIMDSLLQYLVKDGKTIRENDIADIQHAAVPLRFAVVLLLDGAWANFASKLGLPDTQLFAKPQLGQALEAIRTVDISRFRLINPEAPLMLRASS